MGIPALQVIERGVSFSFSLLGIHVDHMAIDVTCPACGKEFSARDDFAGRTVKCKSCGGKITIPTPEQENEDWEETPERDSSLDAFRVREVAYFAFSRRLYR
jgi:hypothetical protein